MTWTVADVPESGFAAEFRGERGLFASVILYAVTDYAVAKSLIDHGVRLECVGIDGNANAEWQCMCDWLFCDDVSGVGSTSLEHACDACGMDVGSVRDLADRMAAFNLARLRADDTRATRQWRKTGHLDLLREYTNRKVTK